MQRISVASSSIEEIGYDADAVALEVLFKNGGLYRYLGVPRDEYEALLAAESLGRYLNLRIKPFYAFVEVRPAR